jgi:HEPN domain-containing protein
VENKDVLDWLNAAEIDVHSARILLREGLYSAAVFHTQQAYEKVYKGCWIYAKHEPESLKRWFGHLNINENIFDKMK